MQRFVFLALALASLTVQVFAQGPRCNIKICFALDSSAGVPIQFFGTGQKLVDNIANRLGSRKGSRVSLAAVQYSTTASAIIPMTNDVSTFRKEVSAAWPDGKTGTFITAGMNYCIAQALSRDVRRTPPKTAIVVIGSGTNSIGADPGLRTSLFESAGGRVFAVGVGNRPNKNGLREIAGSPDRVFTLSPGDTVYSVGLELTMALCGN